MLSKQKIIVVTLIVTALVACKSALYVPTTENANGNISILKEGRSLYIGNCSSCHTLYLPENYNKTEWKKWVDNMADRAHITEEEKAKILAYLSKEQ